MEEIPETWSETRSAWRQLRHNIRAFIAIWLAARLFDVFVKMGAYHQALATNELLKSIPLASEIPELARHEH